MSSEVQAKLVQDIGITVKPFSTNEFILSIKTFKGDSDVDNYELLSSQVAKLAMEAHSVEMTMRGINRSKQPMGRLRKWLLARL